MTLKVLRFKDFNDKNIYTSSFCELGGETFVFEIKWNNYADCAFLSIYDSNDNPIILGRAMVNCLKIRNKYLPYTFVFLHKTSETYEPNLKNLGNEFFLVYDDEEKR